MGNTTKRCEAPTSEVDDRAPRINADIITRQQVLTLATAVMAETGVSVDAMLGRSRVARVSDARQRLWAALWRAGWSIGEIGRTLDRDHTTVMAGLRRVVPGHEYASNVVGRYSADRLGSYRGRLRVSL